MLPIFATSQHESFWAFRFECNLLVMEPHFVLHLMLYTSTFLKVFLNCSTWRQSLLRPKNVAKVANNYKDLSCGWRSVYYSVSLYEFTMGHKKYSFFFLIFNMKTSDNFKFILNTKARDNLKFILDQRQGTILSVPVFTDWVPILSYLHKSNA